MARWGQRPFGRVAPAHASQQLPTRPVPRSVKLHPHTTLWGSRGVCSPSRTFLATRCPGRRQDSRSRGRCTPPLLALSPLGTADGKHGVGKTWPPAAWRSGLPGRGTGVLTPRPQLSPSSPATLRHCTERASFPEGFLTFENLLRDRCPD